MSTEHDVIVIGAGHNGLVTAAVLAKAGMRPLVLERASHIGGCAATTEIAPGCRCPTLTHRVALDANLIATLDLPGRGLHILEPSAHLFVPTGDGRALCVWRDPRRAVREIERFSLRDAAQYPEFLVSLSALTDIVRSAQDRPAPDIDDLALADVTGLLTLGRRFRGLRAADAYRLLRYLPMSAADLVGEWFESEPLRVAIAAAGVLASPVGPRSAESAASLLWMASQGGHPAAPGWQARGGPGAVSQALLGAAKAAGAEVRLGASVERILVRDEHVAGVALESGEDIRAAWVVSSLDPRHTLLGLTEPQHLAPEFRQRLRHVRMRGTLMKVNYAVDGVPNFRGADTPDQATRVAQLSGCVRLCPNLDTLERAFDAAKHGNMSPEPWIELTVPSLLDPTLAPEGTHIVSAYVAYAPIPIHAGAGLPPLDHDDIARRVTTTITRHAPRFDQSIKACQVISPADMERDLGLTGGHPFHGELALDQLFVARPLLGWARHRTPLAGLYLCGAGTHPGDGVTGRSGALAAKRVLADAKQGRGRRAERSDVGEATPASRATARRARPT